MPIRTRTTDGYQQVELTSELLHRQSGSTQQVISTVPCRKHLPFFFAVILADILLFGSVLIFALYSIQFGEGFSIEQQDDAPNKQFNLHALIMLTSFVYFNGQAITAYKSNYIVKHRSVNTLYQFILHLFTTFGAMGGVYFAYIAQQSAQKSKTYVSHFYSVHSWTGIATGVLFIVQFLSGFFSFFVQLFCRKLTARVKPKAVLLHKMLTIIVFCLIVSTCISGLNQLARFELNGVNGKEHYHDFGISTILINLAALSVITGMIAVFFIIFMFKRRQAYDLPILFKLILLFTQIIILILILVIAEHIFQVVTPHVNKVISGELLANSTITHLFNNATQSFNNIYNNAKDQITSSINSFTLLTSSNNSTDNSSSASNNATSISTTAAPIV